MSRIGNRKLTIPNGVEVSINDNIFSAKSSKGELSLNLSPLVKVEINDGKITTNTADGSKELMLCKEQQILTLVIF